MSATSLMHEDAAASPRGRFGLQQEGDGGGASERERERESPTRERARRENTSYRATPRFRDKVCRLWPGFLDRGRYEATFWQLLSPSLSVFWHPGASRSSEELLLQSLPALFQELLHQKISLVENFPAFNTWLCIPLAFIRVSTRDPALCRHDAVTASHYKSVRKWICSKSMPCCTMLHHYWFAALLQMTSNWIWRLLPRWVVQHIYSQGLVEEGYLSV